VSREFLALDTSQTVHTFADAGDARLLSMGGDGRVVHGGVLWRTREVGYLASSYRNVGRSFSMINMNTYGATASWRFPRMGSAMVDGDDEKD
jgi:hypothetical protein